jgi:hypothetical protein
VEHEVFGVVLSPTQQPNLVAQRLSGHPDQIPFGGKGLACGRGWRFAIGIADLRPSPSPQSAAEAGIMPGLWCPISFFPLPSPSPPLRRNRAPKEGMCLGSVSLLLMDFPRQCDGMAFAETCYPCSPPIAELDVTLQSGLQVGDYTLEGKLEIYSCGWIPNLPWIGCSSPPVP